MNLRFGPADPVTRDTLTALLREATAQWALHDLAGARALYAGVLAMADAPSQYKAYAHLRIAQSYRVEGITGLAAAEYGMIKASADYLPHHRAEAGELLVELERQARGLPARDPKASRTSVPRPDKFAAEFWVAPGGNDAHAGTEREPLASLEGARVAVRRLGPGARKGAVAVWIQPGEYKLTQTFALSAPDSGTDASPVVYRAVRQGTAVFRGGARLSGLVPVTDAAILARLPETSRGKVLQCDLKALAITDHGTLGMRGFGLSKGAIATAELYFNGQPMTVARWPKAGFVEVAHLVDPDSTKTSREMTFAYSDPRPARWGTARDAWLFGYWTATWADSAIPIVSVDPAAMRITAANPAMEGRGLNPDNVIRYYVFNLLEELGSPGEWYLDRESGLLYLYPPSDPAQAIVELSMLPVPMVTLDDVSHLRFEGLTFELGRHDGVVIHGGERCLLAGCAIGRLAGGGVRIDGGSGHGVLGCDLFLLGRGGVSLNGGDRETLVPGGHFVENCHIHDFARIDRTYMPAVSTEGVGSRIAHNLIHHGPCHALRVAGNEHAVEFNELHSVVWESDDQGAIDMFGNPTYRGVVFRYNYFHHVGSADGRTAIAGIRLDDAISGLLIYGNVFYRCASGHFGAVQINSGRENIVENNLFADCLRDLSGGWTPGWSENNAFWRIFGEGKSPNWTEYIMSELYLARYPTLKDLRDRPPLNFVWRNVLWNCGTPYAMHKNHVDTIEGAVYANENPGLVDPEHADFRLRADAPLLERLWFRTIPVEEIGLYQDEYRIALPAAATPAIVPDWRMMKTTT